MRTTYGFLLLSAACFASGEYFSRLWAGKGGTPVFLAAVLAYLCGTLLWFPALRQTRTLVITGMLWSLLATLATVLVGVAVFRETLSPLKWAGVLLALASLLILSA